MNAHERLQKALQKFEDQFDVKLEATGHEMSEDRNGGIREEEYWVKDLIESDVNGLNFKVGGWFSIDPNGDDTIYCRLAIDLNGEGLGEMKAVQSRYDKEKQEWTELEYRSM